MAKLANDVFTYAEEAASRSVDMGLGGATHVYDRNGEAVHMPGATHEEYLSWYGYTEAEPMESTRQEDLYTAICAVMDSILKGDTEVDDTTIVGDLMKFDEDQRIVYGWASVVTNKGEPVVDRHGDVIAAETLEKAVNDFMEDVRVAKEMHDGEAIGRVIHSLPVTNAIAKSLGIQSDREGWIVAMKVYDDSVWERVKSGELAAFSIGGRAQKEKIQ